MLCEKLKENFTNLNIINSDILKWDDDKIKYNKVVGNIPYNISSQIIFKFLTKKMGYDVFNGSKRISKQNY